MASEILSEGIIVVFHTLALAVGTHLGKVHAILCGEINTTTLIGLSAERVRKSLQLTPISTSQRKLGAKTECDTEDGAPLSHQ